MTVRYTFLCQPDLMQRTQLLDLYRAVEWDDDDDAVILDRIISGSHCFLVAIAGNAIVGMGRAISDGVNDAYIQDVAVLPAFRHRGIGAEIVRRLADRLAEDGLRWIGLIAANGTASFYEKLGFHAMPHAAAMLRKEGKAAC